MAVVPDGTAEALLGPVDPVLDGVLVQHQPFGGGLVAPAGVEEHEQGLAQAGVVLVVGGQLPRVLSTQARSRSAEPSIIATGATSP